MKKHLIKAFLISAIFYPLSVFATNVTDFSGLGKFINDFKENVIVNLSALFLTTAVVAFFYGVVVYIYSIRNGEERGVTNGKNFMLWGLIALFVMFSVWGIVKFAQKVIGIEGQTEIDIPSIKFKNSGSVPATGGAGPVSGGQSDSFLNSLFSGGGDVSTGNNNTNNVYDSFYKGLVGGSDGDGDPTKTVSGGGSGPTSGKVDTVDTFGSDFNTALNGYKCGDDDFCAARCLSTKDYKLDSVGDCVYAPK